MGLRVTKICKVGYSDQNNLIIYEDENKGIDLRLVHKKTDLSWFQGKKVRVTVEVVD